MLEKLACSLGRKDEEPNIELAESLCENNDKSGIKEIVDGMNGSDKAITNDCIKVLYEIGYRKQVLIADYVNDFISHLQSKNNRLVWGSMTALAAIADLKAKEIYEKLNFIMKAYETGSVITIDNCITVLAKLCKADLEYEKAVLPLIIKHLASCRPKEVPQHAERASICINKENVTCFLEVLDKRKSHMNEAQNKRINKLVKDLMRRS